MYRGKLIIPILLPLVLVLFTSSPGAQADEIVLAADHAFNANHIEEAEALYRRAFAAASARGDRLAAAEIINDLAAVQQVRGNADKFASWKAEADRETRAIASIAASVQHADSRNLLVDGDFEGGLALPWGTGNYEQRHGIWWNSQRVDVVNGQTIVTPPARGYMKIDTDIRHAGERSLRITNYSKGESGVYVTTAQRIEGLEPDSIYRISLYAKAQDLHPRRSGDPWSGAQVIIDPDWKVRPLTLPAGSYDWRSFTADVNIGHNAFIDFRIVLADVGTLWLDDIRVEKLADESGDLGQQAEAAFDHGQFAKALDLVDRVNKQRSSEPGIQVWVHRKSVQINAALGQYDQALADYDWLIQNRASHPDIDLTVADILAARGEVEKAIDSYNRLADAERPRPGSQGNQGQLATVLEKLARISVVAARAAGQSNDSRELAIALSRADQAMVDATAIFRNTNNSYGLALLARTAAELAILRGDAAAAERQAGEGLARVASLGDPMLESSLWFVRGEAADRRGEVSAALQAYDVAGSLLEKVFDTLGTLPADAIATFVAQSRQIYDAYLARADDAARLDPAVRPTLTATSFQKAQWATLSTAAAALVQVAARGAAGDPALAARVGELQDLNFRVQHLQQEARTTTDGRPAPQLQHDIDALAARREQIRRQIDTEFPRYAALAAPRPITIENVKALLRPDEALVQFASSRDVSFAWVVTRDAVRSVRIDVGAAFLQRDVSALRCGLDYSGSWLVKDSPCRALTNVAYTAADWNAGKPLPFELARAHALYLALFSQVEDLLAGKSLLIIHSGALTQLPFQVLVTAAPDPALGGAAALRSARWLIRDHALTVLPSVSSLRALRELGKPSRASRTMIGFGNPLLDGGPGDAERARRAQLNTTCPVEVASRATGVPMGLAQLSVRRGHADVAVIRSATPLPETADELCAVARDLQVAASDIHLGAQATLPEVLRLSEAGELQAYHLVHFATHGALSGQVTGTSEPGLILTPPAIASEADDGYLSASHIAGLKLDADWVILSACNTAAGGTTGAEALSGLARAFFYAGARALLVSHWEVYSQAAVELVTGALRRVSSDKNVGRAEALRQSMMSLIDTGTDREVYPAVWAPFIIVGEGSAGN